MRSAAGNPSVTGASAGDTSPFRGGKAALARNDTGDLGLLRRGWRPRQPACWIWAQVGGRLIAAPTESGDADCHGKPPFVSGTPTAPVCALGHLPRRGEARRRRAADRRPYRSPLRKARKGSPPSLERLV